MKCCLITILVVALLGCKGSPTTSFDLGLDSPEQMTLYSIDGREGKQVESKEFFHNYPVLGKVEITDPAMRAQLISALKDGIARRPEHSPKCFWPRHGLKVTANGRTVEYVICFECSSLQEYVGEMRQRSVEINSDVQTAFDKPLKEAGVPLAPK